MRHFSVVGVLFVTLCMAGPVQAGMLSEYDLDLYRAVFRYADTEHWDDAVRMAAGPRERLPAKVIHWLDLCRPQSGNGFNAITDFMNANPHWPNQAALQRQAEATMPTDLSEEDVIAWFTQHPPVSANGVLRYAEALKASGEGAKATEMVRRFWLDANFTNADDEIDFRHTVSSLLSPKDHLARLDRLLWDHQTGAARRLMPLVDEGHQALAEARLALADDDSGSEGLIRRVPAALLNDPGLLYERLRWRRSRDNDAGALEILQAPPAELGRPALWWTERSILARRLIERQDFAAAYRLVRNHGQMDGQSLAEAEFLAGWLALRFLKQPSEAFEHFSRMYRSANTVMSKSRGAYWCARAAEAEGDSDKAHEWYTTAAKYPTMFYGQLAFSTLDPNKPLALTGDPKPSPSQSAAFNRNELVRIVRLLREIDPHDPTDRIGLFIRRLSKDATTAEDFALISHLALEIRRPELAISVAKRAIQTGVVLSGAGYPTIALHQTNGVEPGLILSLIRQESTFNTTTVSKAGARGLMQLMPPTAQLMAGILGLRYTESRLINDPDYNIMLGSSYISHLIDNYNGSYVLAIAAYNAGSGRVHEWVSNFGDPRGDGVDVIDWIELIPIAETRNYVQRVLEALQVYRFHLGQSNANRALKRDLRR